MVSAACTVESDGSAKFGSNHNQSIAPLATERITEGTNQRIELTKRSI